MQRKLRWMPVLIFLGLTGCAHADSVIKTPGLSPGALAYRQGTLWIANRGQKNGYTYLARFRAGFLTIALTLKGYQIGDVTSGPQGVWYTAEAMSADLPDFVGLMS